MGEFKRGVSSQFIAALRKHSETEGWWRDVLQDNSLIIAVRDERLHVYWHGQRIFEINIQKNAIVAKTHPKYLLDPDLERLVPFDGHQFKLGSLEASALIRTYQPGETLSKLKRAADLFADDEKRGVHNIVTSNDHVVDVEITMQANDVPDVGKLPRPDIAAFEKDEQDVRFVLWEAKTFYNKELRATGKKNVLSQIKKYKAVVAALRMNIIKSYSCVARNLVDIADMSLGRRKVSDLVRKVARGEAKLMVHDPADVGLLVFDFNEVQRELILKPLLRDTLKAIRVKTRGETKGWKI